VHGELVTLPERRHTGMLTGLFAMTWMGVVEPGSISDRSVGTGVQAPYKL
jgi:hypothetical protein